MSTRSKSRQKTDPDIAKIIGPEPWPGQLILQRSDIETDNLRLKKLNAVGYTAGAITEKEILLINTEILAMQMQQTMIRHIPEIMQGMKEALGPE